MGPIAITHLSPGSVISVDSGTSPLRLLFLKVTRSDHECSHAFLHSTLQPYNIYCTVICIFNTYGQVGGLVENLHITWYGC